MNTSIKLAKVGGECVACGSCVTVCPRGAITVRAGVTAVVDEGLCIGCGKCARTCPADVIALLPRRAAV